MTAERDEARADVIARAKREWETARDQTDAEHRAQGFRGGFYDAAVREVRTSRAYISELEAALARAVEERDELLAAINSDEPVQTQMFLPAAEDWPDVTMRVRRVGWLDQRGRVWYSIPPSDDFDGGSLTPLLVQDDELRSKRLTEAEDRAADLEDRAARVIAHCRKRGDLMKRAWINRRGRGFVEGVYTAREMILRMIEPRDG